MKIIQIDGIRGLITAAFIGVCLFAGFVIFPGFVAQYMWNKYLVSSLMFPVLNLLQGVLLWGIVAISYCILSKKGFAISFKEPPTLSDDELNSIINKAKIHSKMKKINTMVQKSDSFEKNNNSVIDKDLSHMSSPIRTSDDISVENKEEETVSKL
ncbi:hypothetical protein HDR58_04560 [bacterium]|nr:hypothetical protein [bacterium]